MRRSIISFLIVVIISIFISACSISIEQQEESFSGMGEAFDTRENETGVDIEIKTSEIHEETSSLEAVYGQGWYIDDDGNVHYFPVTMPTVRYNGYDYMQYGNPWWNMDEDWLNENYTYLGDVEYYPDRAPIEDRGDFTTNIDKDGCKIYQCNEENTYLFTLWSDGVVRLFVQSDLTEEERESASAATDWKS